MKRTLAYGAATTQGHSTIQSDGYYVDPSKHFYLLANGLGGQSGEKAAKNMLFEMAEALRGPVELAPVPDTEILSKEEFFLWEHFLRLHAKQRGDNEKLEWPERSASSLLVAWKSQDRKFTLVNCGSSGAMVFRNGQFHPVLQPQTRHGTVCIASQAVGLGMNIEPEYKSVFLGDHELLLLYTGGVLEAIPNLAEFCAGVLASITRQEGEALTHTAQALLEAVIAQAPSIDNASLILVEGASEGFS